MMRNLLAALFLLTSPAIAQEIPASPIAKAQLLIHAPSVKAGQPIRAGVLFTLPPGWHIYWQNPGDSGIPTALNWTLPEGITAGDIQWPTPERIDTSGIINYGYGEKVILSADLMPERDGLQGDISVQADWLVCKEICIPESATLTATLPTSSPQAQLLLDEVKTHLPLLLPAKASYRRTGSSVELTFPAATAPQELRDGALVQWFPIEDGIMRNAGATKFTCDNTGDCTLTFAQGASDPVEIWHGILILQATPDADIQSYRIDALHGEDTSAPTPPSAAPDSALPLLVALAFAFLGGLLLNIMPCVLPILSLKALALAKKSGSEQRAAQAQGLAYTLGVIASFLAIAGVMLVLKTAGASIGWGFQLQQPEVIAGLALLMLLVALNLLGQFELPVLLGSAQTDQHSRRGAFFTGALAVAVATPCTAPFMAPAIGATLTLGTPQTLLVFAAIGLGMAAPFLLISLWPAARRLLPTPGVWMLRFKQFLAFPMLATGAWLLWVLVQINGIGGIQILMAAALMAAWLLWWAHGTLRHLSKTLLRLLAAVIVLWGILAQPPALSPAAPNRGEAFSAERLAALRAEGRPVFVDATAAWCLTCKINERVALENATTKALFAEKNIALLIADWTTRDAAITDYLASFGRNGVPLYVYYPTNAEPVVLPQLLTPALVQETLRR